MELYHLKIYIDDLLHRAVVSKGARKPKVFLTKHYRIKKEKHKTLMFLFLINHNDTILY